MNNNFTKYKLDKEILSSLNSLNYNIPTRVQNEVIPILLNKEDIIVKSKTGSGKTASFAIPICEKININDNTVQGLIVVPTRELALQVKEEISSIGRLKKIRCIAIFGKQPIKDQISQLKQRVHIVVATPGRIIDHIGRKTINIEGLKFFIIDEADKMLNKGFAEDMETILNRLPRECVKGLFSATIDDNISEVCSKYMTNPKYVDINQDEVNNFKKQIIEKYIKVNEDNRYEVLKKIIYNECPNSVIIFANKKDAVRDLHEKMKKDKFLVGQLHGDMSQDKRLFTIKDFKEYKFNILVSTDVASRGIHIDDISLVINYQVPKDKENYIHRIGRTGRYNKFGKAITLVSENEEKYLNEIEEYTNSKLDEIKELDDQKVKRGKIEFKVKEKELLNTVKEKNKDKKTNLEVTRIYLNAGKKKKIRVIDIVGALSNIEGINNEDIGVIEVQELCSYVDLLNNKGSKFLKEHRGINIKKKLVKVRKDNKL